MNPSNESHEKLTLSMAETATLLGIGLGTAYKAAKRGEIPIIKFGRSVRVPRAALFRLLGNTSSNDPPLEQRS